MRRVVCGNTTASLRGSNGYDFEVSNAIRYKDSIFKKKPVCI